MRKSGFLMLKALKSAPHPNDSQPLLHTCRHSPWSGTNQISISVHSWFYCFFLPHTLCTHFWFTVGTRDRIIFFLPTFNTILLLDYHCLVQNVLFVYLIRITFYLPPHVSSCLFYVLSYLNFISPYKYKYTCFISLFIINHFVFTLHVSSCLFYVRSNLILFHNCRPKLHLPYTFFDNHHGEYQSYEP